MRFDRAAGVILHPTSLPGFGGIGSLGTEAHAFVDALADAGIRLWQVLPLGPTGYGDAPYSTLSAFAGNPLLIALEPLVDDGLLEPEDLTPLAYLPETHVDFGFVVPNKMGVLRRSFERYPGSKEHRIELARFAAKNAGWLEDFALFMALKDEHDLAAWKEWEPDIRLRRPEAVEAARRRLEHEIEFHRYVQWLFFSQWEDLKAYANGRDVRIIGDIPIFVAYDSADVWANQRLFKLDPEGAPTVVAGVPPDYFSATGQRWGNPHYRWDVLRRRRFDWWIERFRMLFELVDIARIDHFRGFAGAWEVPSEEETAVRGEWVPAPGGELFEAVQEALGDSCPIIAEDLGVITPDVVELRDRFGFPGMKILQFAFGTDATNPSLPHNFVPNTVVYTGTHDNDTTVGWFSSIAETERKVITAYSGTSGLDIAWDLIRLAFASVADLALTPLQDVLRLGSTGRMNLPGSASGNWSWRFTRGSITPEHVRGLRFLAETYGRTAPSVTVRDPYSSLRNPTDEETEP